LFEAWSKTLRVQVPSIVSPFTSSKMWGRCWVPRMELMLLTPRGPSSAKRWVATLPSGLSSSRLSSLMLGWSMVKSR